MGLIIPLLLLGVLASLSPSTLVVFILLLATARARVNASAFLVGWIASLSLVFVVSYTLGSYSPVHHGRGGPTVDVIEVLLGLALVAVGVRQWRRRRLPRENDGLPHWLTDRLHRLAPWGATVMGILMQPWTLTAAAAIVVVRHHAALPIALFAFAFFMVVSTATVGAIYLYYAKRPGEAQARLDALRDRVVRSAPTLAAAVSLAVGLVLVVDGVLGLGPR